MKHFFPLILILILILTGCSASKPEAAYKQLSMSEAMDLMESEKDYIIDKLSLERKAESNETTKK